MAAACCSDAFAQLPDEVSCHFGTHTPALSRWVMVANAEEGTCDPQIVAVILEAAVGTASDVARLACICNAFRRVLRHATLTVRGPPAPGRPISLACARKIFSSLSKCAPGMLC